MNAHTVVWWVVPDGAQFTLAHGSLGTARMLCVEDFFLTSSEALAHAAKLADDRYMRLHAEAEQARVVAGRLRKDYEEGVTR